MHCAINCVSEKGCIAFGHGGVQDGVGFAAKSTSSWPPSKMLFFGGEGFGEVIRGEDCKDVWKGFEGIGH